MNGLGGVGHPCLGLWVTVSAASAAETNAPAAVTHGPDRWTATNAPPAAATNAAPAAVTNAPDSRAGSR